MSSVEVNAFKKKKNKKKNGEVRVDKVAEKQVGKNKPAGNNKGKRKKMIPLQLFAAAKEGFQGVETDEVDASVMYHKSVTGAVQIAVKDIKKRGDQLDSFDLLMFLPGYGALTTSGTLCDLMGSSYVLTNPSPFSVTIRTQRPMGFKEDVSSLAMWEPLGNKLVYEIPPRGELRLGSNNGSTSHMVPRELTKRGKRCVHLLSFSVFREPLSDYGTALKDADLGDEVGLVVEVVTRYKCMNGEVGQMDSYIVESFRGANRLNHVNVGPLVDLRFCDINVPGGPVSFVNIVEAGDRAQIVFSNDGKNFVTDCDLDKMTIYRFSVPITMSVLSTKANGVACYISWVKSGSSAGYWTPGFLPGANAQNFEQGVILKGAYLPLALPAGEWLYPVGIQNKTSLSSRRKGGVTAVQHSSVKIRGWKAHHDLDAGLLETVVKGLVIIYEVTKVAVEILGVVGVLANPELKNVEGVTQHSG